MSALKGFTGPAGQLRARDRGIAAGNKQPSVARMVDGSYVAIGDSHPRGNGYDARVYGAEGASAWLSECYRMGVLSTGWWQSEAA
jgi:hypothetical protein